MLELIILKLKRFLELFLFLSLLLRFQNISQSRRLKIIEDLVSNKKNFVNCTKKQLVLVESELE